MAAFQENPSGYNQTNVGSDKAVKCGLGVQGSGATFLVLKSADGTEVLIWARNDGKLYGGTRANYESGESAGTALW